MPVRFRTENVTPGLSALVALLASPQHTHITSTSSFQMGDGQTDMMSSSGHQRCRIPMVHKLTHTRKINVSKPFFFILFFFKCEAYVN